MSRITRNELLHFLQTYLKPHLFEDMAYNGLQIEGKEEIRSIAFAVSANQESILQTLELKADALIVHHGLIWNYQKAFPLAGPITKRFFPLIQNGVNLLAYHLPLDAHLIDGNAASLAKKIKLCRLKPFGDYKGSPLGVVGSFAKTIMVSQLKKVLSDLLQKEVIVSTPNPKGHIKTLGIITGGANSEWRLAKKWGLDGFLTGEMKEYDWYDAKEAGIHFFAGGHHATEQFGIQSIMERIHKKFKIPCTFLPSINPN